MGPAAPEQDDWINFGLIDRDNGRASRFALEVARARVWSQPKQLALFVPHV